MLEIILSLCAKGLAAAVAAFGFSIVLNSPRSSFVCVPILAFLGLVVRNALWIYFGLQIGLATFCGALLMGFVGVYFGRRNRCPVEVYCVPALLPMIPGFWAYKSLLAFFQFVENVAVFHPVEGVGFTELREGVVNMSIAVVVLFGLGIGVTIPIFLFAKRSFNMAETMEPEKKELL